MGWNEGFTILEHTVITLYDEGVLTKELLEKIVEPFKETDCDSGGAQYLLSKDGLCVEHIICKVLFPTLTYYAETYPLYENDYELEEDSDNWLKNERAYNLWEKIWHQHWGNVVKGETQMKTIRNKLMNMLPCIALMIAISSLMYTLFVGYQVNQTYNQIMYNEMEHVEEVETQTHYIKDGCYMNPNDLTEEDWKHWTGTVSWYDENDNLISETISFDSRTDNHLIFNK